MFINASTIDLIHIREELKQIFPESEVIFNLNLFGYEDKKQTQICKIPAYYVPNSDQLKLRHNDFLAYKGMGTDYDGG